MKIWGEVPKITGIYGNAGKAEKLSKSQSVASKKDQLTLSGPARDFTVAMKALRNVPDIRRDKVEAILERINRGEYNVSAEDVAAKITELMMRGF